MTDSQHVRNFSIIAHIDHGKSTLADRFIQLCGGLSDREMENQVLDSMDLERERGITIKAQSVSLEYQSRSGDLYELNLIDTPGHVDFSYEVSRSLAACEGALLVVDAAQGVEAQSVANCYTAIDLDLEVVPVLNKIDLPSADPQRVKQEIEEIIGLDAEDAVLVSAKTGEGIQDVLEELITRIPPPQGDADAPLKVLIVDSWFDNYVGVVSLVRIVDGRLSRRDKIRVMSTGRNFQVEKLGKFTPKPVERQMLQAGDVGFLVAGIKDIDGAPVGDTLTLVNVPAETPLPGFKMEVRTDTGARVPERHAGTVYVRGPSVMSGYFNDVEATSKSLSADGWLNTGDIGYRVGDRLFLTGRKKDLIIINGRNVWPQDLEYIAEDQPEVRPNDALAFSVPDGDNGEKAVLVVQCRESDPGKRQDLIKRLKSLVYEELAVECIVDLVPLHTLPRTSSGKLSRSWARLDFLGGNVRRTDEDLLGCHARRAVKFRVGLAVHGYAGAFEGDAGKQAATA